MQVVSVNAKVDWKVSKDSESGKLVAICDPLLITIEADNWVELRENICDALRLVLGEETCQIIANRLMMAQEG